MVFEISSEFQMYSKYIENRILYENVLLWIYTVPIWKRNQYSCMNKNKLSFKTLVFLVWSDRKNNEPLEYNLFLVMSFFREKKTRHMGDMCLIMDTQ